MADFSVQPSGKEGVYTLTVNARASCNIVKAPHSISQSNLGPHTWTEVTLLEKGEYAVIRKVVRGKEQLMEVEA